jgi:hypothetical protein
MTIRMSLMLLAAVGGSQLAAANTIHVCPACAHTTIQSAVDAAASHDVILIAPGRFQENVTVQGKSVTLQGSEASNGITEVSAAGRGPVFTLGSAINGAAAELVQLVNLTISGGNHFGGTGEGGGVQVRAGAYLQLTSSIITQNRATKGGGVSIDSPGSPASTITDCQIINNLANGTAYPVGGPGGGVFVAAGSSLTIQNSVITHNTASDGGGVFTDVNTSLVVANSNISNNISQPYNISSGNPTAGGGGGLETFGSFNIAGSTFNNNLALGPAGGGGALLNLHENDGHFISTSIVARNNTRTGNNPAEGIAAGVLVNTVASSVQPITLSSVYIVENLQFGGLWLVGADLISNNTTVADNIGGQICSSITGCTP